MKPHEETWDNGLKFEVAVCGPELDRDLDAPREVLARAAPEMARAILRHLDTFPKCSCGACARCDMQNAIAKAGVVP